MPPLTHARRRHRLAGREAAARRPRRQGADPQRPPGAEVRHGRPHGPHRPGRHPARQAPPHPHRGRPDPPLPPAHGRLLEGVRRPASAGAAAPTHQIRAILGTADRTAVGYRLPVLELLRTTDEHTRRRPPRPRPPGPGLGPRPAPSPTSSPDPDRPLGEALLDQRNLAGIGNVYKSELCFLLGVTPWLPVGALPADRAAQLPALAKKLLEANRDRPVRTTTGRRGQDLFVYGRAPRPCLRCRTPIRVGRPGRRLPRTPHLLVPHTASGPGPEPHRRARRARTASQNPRRTTN